MEENKSRMMCFDSDHAVKYGVNAAILINYFKFFIELNIKLDMEGERKAGNSSYRAGRTYSYISKAKLAEHFPFFTEAKVKLALNKLVAADVFITGCYNKMKYDKTLWYAFKNEEEFLELPAQYKQFLLSQSADSATISANNNDAGELHSNPRKSTLGNNNQQSESECKINQMDDTFMSDSMDISRQSIGQESPTIPINTNIIQNRKENTYLPINSGESNTSTHSLSDIVDEGELDDELLAWMDVAYNTPPGKVGSKGFSAAGGSCHNAVDICSIADKEKLVMILEKFVGKPLGDMEYVQEWYVWIQTKQTDVSEIKHGKAWVKSYLKFAESNAAFAQAKEHEALRKKEEDEIARRPKYPQNPYNQMKK